MKSLKNKILISLFQNFHRITIPSESNLGTETYLDCILTKSSKYLLPHKSLDLTYFIKYTENSKSKFPVEFKVPERSTDFAISWVDQYGYTTSPHSRITRIDKYTCAYERETSIQTTVAALSNIRKNLKYISTQIVIMDKSKLLTIGKLERWA